MALKRRHDSKMMYGDGKMSRTRRESPTLNGDNSDMICNSRGGSSDLKTSQLEKMRLKGDSPEGEGGTFNMYGGTESMIVTGCNPKEFKRVVSRISNERIILISEMGFGPVHNFRCGELNLPLCEMLLNNFDVKNQTIQIHGRHVSITEKDLGRSMGVRCRGTEVDIDCSTGKCEAAEWKKRLCGNDTDINLKSLKKTIVYTDDNELFMVSFALFALATMFCPSTPGYVDPRFLVPLRNPHAIRSHNWGQFCYTKLVEGVASYQSGNPSPNLGCLVFLQIFYLSVLGERMLIVPRCSLPVMAWGVKESNRVFEKVKELGGFNARQGVWVTKRFASFGASEYSGSRDKSTGLKTNLFDDMSDLKKEVAVVEDEIGSLESIFSSLHPDIAELRRAITSLHRVVVKREAEPPNSVVNEPLEKTTREVIAQMRRGTPSGMLFGSVANISPKEGELLRYLFSQKGNAEDIIGSDEVGRYMEVTVSRYHLNCLTPKRCLNSEVINIMGAYIFGNSTVDWFLPTYFSIFIPILDTVAKHWILAVVKVSYGDCEIWDSNPEVAAEQRRKDYVIAAIDLLLSVFAAELRESPWVCSEATSFTFFYPASCPIQVNDFDSGICVIRNMQFYDQRWHEGFNSGDQRMRIALEIVNNPLNECRDAVRESVYQEHKNVSNSRNIPGSDTTDPLLIRAGMKFKPRVPRR
ncbi:hypothetical protein ACLB2K_032099 [Fragaria x ananassa]